MIHKWHSNHSLWRLPVALIIVLGLALVASEPAAHAEDGWPRLPTDAEIAQARDRLVADWTFSRPPCASECDANQSAYDYKLCLARACLNEFRMGQEVRESAMTETEIVKAHNPEVEDPVAASYVFVLYTLKQTVEYSNHQITETVEYGFERLAYGLDPSFPTRYQQWYTTQNRIEFDVIQDDPASRPQRDAVIDSYFKGGRLIRGFPGEAAVITPTPDPRLPCPWPAFFYPGMSFDGYFTGEPSLRYSSEQMVANLAEGLQSYINEGNEPSLGIQATDVYYVPKTYASTAMPTGGEALLQQMARDMAAEKQRSDPGYRLKPGDLFYLSLKVNHGNVRDALLTCHAALYRDGPKVNKAFIEQENVLQPLRNPAGYADGQWSYKTPVGSTRTINPRKEVGSDEQGVWYHFFGMAALEFTDQYGAASYYGAWEVVSWGGMNANYTDRVIARGFPISNMGGGLADLAIALEDNIRTNYGAAPDVSKYCINYYAAAAGRELKHLMSSYFELQPNPIKERFKNLGGGGDILNPNTTVTYRSPLSLRIEGANGEWFTFDQPTGALDGNTASIYFEAFPEEDGSRGVVAVPFFEVASMQMVATGDGPVTLALYDPASTGSSVYEFEVQAGDDVRVPDGALAAVFNGEPLVPSYETAGTEAPSLPERSSGRAPGPLLVGVLGGVLLAGVAVGLIIWRVSKRQPARPHPVVPPSSTAAQGGRTTPPGSRADEGARSGWQLLVVGGADTGRRFVLEMEAHLGRSMDNDVCIDDEQASRQHALLRCQSDGCELYDLDSRNGTWVNGVRIGQPTRLQAGDIIQLGNTSLCLVRAGD